MKHGLYQVRNISTIPIVGKDTLLELAATWLGISSAEIVKLICEHKEGALIIFTKKELVEQSGSIQIITYDKISRRTRSCSLLRTANELSCGLIV